MSTPFSRSMRSLDADGFRTSTLGLLSVAAILGAWIAWFFLARIALYETTATAHLVGEVKVVADFPLVALARIRPGQPARLRLDGFPWAQYGTIPATVASVARTRNGRARVELTVHPDPASPIPLQRGLTGTVEVEVDLVSPATLVLRTVGQLLTTPDSQSGREVNR